MDAGVPLSVEAMVVGGFYNWRNQPERLVYLGARDYPGNGRWHQFAKVEDPGTVWCEVRAANLASFEATVCELPAWASDAQVWGGALNSASWEFDTVYRKLMGEPTPDKLFNHLKVMLREVILHYAQQVATQAQVAPAVAQVPQDCDVRTILLDVAPGDGDGVEVYARSVADVEDKLTRLGEELEEWQLGIRRYTAPEAPAQAAQAPYKPCKTQICLDCGMGPCHNRPPEAAAQADWGAHTMRIWVNEHGVECAAGRGEPRKFEDVSTAQAAPPTQSWDDAKQAELNDWFLSLPEGRQRVLVQDKWMLAAAAFDAGKAAPPTQPEAAPSAGERERNAVKVLDEEIHALQAELAKTTPYPTETSSWNRAVSRGRLDGLLFARAALNQSREQP